MKAQTAARFPARWRLVLVVLTFGFVTAVMGCGGEPDQDLSKATPWTRGPVPASAMRPDGSVDMSQVPDFVPAAKGDLIAGWVAASDLFPAPGAEPPASPRVYGDDLVTVVGHMYPGVGFVPLGSEAEMLPDPSRNRSLSIVVRNESDSEAVLEMTEARDEARGRALLLIAPIVIKPGEEREVLFESPLDRWSLNLQGDPGFFFSDDLGPRSRTPGFALVITANRVLEMTSTE